MQSFCQAMLQQNSYEEQQAFRNTAKTGDRWRFWFSYFRNIAKEGDRWRFWFSYHGRLNRKPYIFGSFAVGVVGTAASAMLDAIWFPGSLIVAFPVLILCVVACACLTIRRFHDLNRSGWLYFLTFIPLLNIILGFYLVFVRGTCGMNRYGPDPLENR